MNNAQYSQNTVSNKINQSPNRQVNYNHEESVTNFTPQSANFKVPANSSNHAGQQNSPSYDQFLQPQGEFVIETFKLGSRYEGYKLNGMRHGQGKFFYQDGGMYDGQWVRNKMEGYGKLYYQSGNYLFNTLRQNRLWRNVGPRPIHRTRHFV